MQDGWTGSAPDKARSARAAGGQFALAALVLVLFFAIIVFGVYGAQYSANAFVYAGF